MAEQRYRVVDRLEAGGMAEVFRGEAVSVQGFRKEVAIKRVLPHLAQNENFIAMFLDEARLGARLTHANIVAVNDIGSADNTYFIVMEFVEGANLKHVIEHYRRTTGSFPIKEAVFVAAEVCRGLSYAHELLDDEGGILGIVHRDVSPPNILLSKRGEVKVTDFGLAKAKTQLEKTDPGVVKGKFSYLSPEAAMGLAVDARADLFALGIVLWEMLAGRRLFLGETDYQTVKLVQQANVPELERLHPEVDDELNGIVGKALAKDRDARFQSAREMGDALAGYLFNHKLKVTSYDIAAMVKETLVERAKQKSGAPQQSIIDRLISEELLRFTSIDEESGADGSGAGSEPLSADSLSGESPSAEPEGSAALDPGDFENPTEWFDDDADFGGDAFDTAQAGAAQPDPSSVTGPAEEVDGDLLEELDDALEEVEEQAMEERPTHRRAPAAAPEVDPTRKLSAVEKAARSGAAPAPMAATDAAPSVDRFSEPPPSGVPEWLFAVIAVVLLLAGAGVAWLMS